MQARAAGEDDFQVKKKLHHSCELGSIVYIYEYLYFVPNQGRSLSFRLREKQNRAKKNGTKLEPPCFEIAVANSPINNTPRTGTKKMIVFTRCYIQ